MLSGSLSQTKHGQKVLTKLQKAHPHIFTTVGASTGANPMLTGNPNGNCQVKQGAPAAGSHQQQSSGQ